jgi:hypothetical protein
MLIVLSILIVLSVLSKLIMLSVLSILIAEHNDSTLQQCWR